MALGLYISVPFCRTKCTYCNFASDVFSRAIFDRYVDRLCSDLERAQDLGHSAGGRLEPVLDSVYLGGGTPTLLDSHQLRSLFVTIKQNFCLQPNAELTVECAPGTLNETVIGSLIALGVNRVSLGVQSFVNQEAASVGRLHKRDTVFEDTAMLHAAGISNINIDLIAGLPHQTPDSWDYSIRETIAIGVPHVSVYMLEIDQDSRLGRELVAGGTRYHAHFVPNEDMTADMYLAACERLNAAGVPQYEISNFARPGFESQHNLKYWTRQPYLGVGVDAHSMLKISEDVLGHGRPSENIDPAAGGLPEDAEYVRLATSDVLEKYVAEGAYQPTFVSRQASLEEAFFLGLRMNRGVDLNKLKYEFGDVAISARKPEIDDLVNDGLLERSGTIIRLTARGRLLSNEVFERFVFTKAA